MLIAKFSDKNYLDLAYLKKFALLFFSLYVFNHLYTGLITPDNIYSPFIAENLNYISWLTTGLLYSSNAVCQLFGMDTFIADADSLKVAGGRGVYVGIPCLGLGVMIFWISFMLAAAEGWKKKISWCLAGLAAIWLINSLRVAFILQAYQENWQMVTNLDHHTAFNIFSYLVIFFMIWLFYRSNGKEMTNDSTEARL